MVWKTPITPPHSISMVHHIVLSNPTPVLSISIPGVNECKQASKRTSKEEDQASNRNKAKPYQTISWSDHKTSPRRPDLLEALEEDSRLLSTADHSHSLLRPGRTAIKPKIYDDEDEEKNHPRLHVHDLVLVHLQSHSQTQHSQATILVAVPSSPTVEYYHPRPRLKTRPSSINLQLYKQGQAI
ncbi:hypothetical protein BU24DRAFT_197562 [Aaosphaeria arxii CBS 175.79]|uniref:Uncharacterized protein n=1 Tax=Aaosphaeria arxii CBS 175.79 TaxID=1450172 RepID=A0A6A5XU72_9PLEO|nr:uncharacterized protein BU24DRAFT_197562 [Aaosphaeria arxii CBS 175.79]KAF2016261.1 hypothetical protein BU24DRAFT_197562 [Aaosphaeria arxii CBS 175.79]